MKTCVRCGHPKAAYCFPSRAWLRKHPRDTGAGAHTEDASQASHAARRRRTLGKAAIAPATLGKPGPGLPKTAAAPAPAYLRNGDAQRDEIPAKATLRHELVVCGKRKCRCRGKAIASLHGPYWYAYWQGKGGRTCKRYIGKALPRSIVDRRLAPKRRQRRADGDRILAEYTIDGDEA